MHSYQVSVCICTLCVSIFLKTLPKKIWTRNLKKQVLEPVLMNRVSNILNFRTCGQKWLVRIISWVSYLNVHVWRNYELTIVTLTDSMEIKMVVVSTLLNTTQYMWRRRLKFMRKRISHVAVSHSALKFEPNEATLLLLRSHQYPSPKVNNEDKRAASAPVPHKKTTRLQRIRNLHLRDCWKLNMLHLIVRTWRFRWVWWCRRNIAYSLRKPQWKRAVSEKVQSVNEHDPRKLVKRPENGYDLMSIQKLSAVRMVL